MTRIRAAAIAFVSVCVISIASAPSRAGSVAGKGPTAVEQLEPLTASEVLRLLHYETVVKDLNLTPSQIEALNKADEKYEADLVKLRSGAAVAQSRSEYKEAIDNIGKQIAPALVVALDGRQMSRLKEIGIQYLGVAVLAKPSVANPLGLSDAQKQRLKDLYDDRADQLRSSRARTTTLSEFRKQFDEKMMAILTPEQKTRFEAMSGKTIDLSERPLDSYDLATGVDASPSSRIRALYAGAQGPQARRLFGNSVDGTSEALRLFRSDNVRKDLGLCETQSKAIDMDFAQLHTQLATIRQITDPAEGLKQLFAADSATLEKIGRLLNDKQADRFHEIIIQSQGTAALYNPDVANALQLTDEQKRGLDELRTKRLAEAREAAQHKKIIFPIGASRAKVLKSLNDEVLAILTPDQRTQFEKMQGKKIDLTRRRSATGASSQSNSSTIPPQSSSGTR